MASRKRKAQSRLHLLLPFIALTSALCTVPVSGAGARLANIAVTVSPNSGQEVLGLFGIERDELDDYEVLSEDLGPSSLTAVNDFKIDVEEGFLFFSIQTGATEFSVIRTDVQGENPTTILSADTPIVGLAVDLKNTILYASLPQSTEETGGVIKKMPYSGQDPLNFEATLENPGQMIVDAAGSIYWTETRSGGGGAIARSTDGGATKTDYLVTPDATSWFALDGNRLARGSADTPACYYYKVAAENDPITVWSGDSGWEGTGGVAFAEIEDDVPVLLWVGAKPSGEAGFLFEAPLAALDGPNGNETVPLNRTAAEFLSPKGILVTGLGEVGSTADDWWNWRLWPQWAQYGAIGVAVVGLLGICFIIIGLARPSKKKGPPRMRLVETTTKSPTSSNAPPPASRMTQATAKTRAGGGGPSNAYQSGTSSASMVVEDEIGVLDAGLGSFLDQAPAGSRGSMASNGSNASRGSRGSRGGRGNRSRSRTSKTSKGSRGGGHRKGRSSGGKKGKRSRSGPATAVGEGYL